MSYPAKLPQQQLDLALAVRTQADAKAAAELILKKTIQPHQIRGRYCLFIKGTTKTNYVGSTWRHAVLNLLRQLAEKEGADEQAQKQIQEAQEAHASLTNVTP